MTSSFRILFALIAAAALVQGAQAQESKAATATRKKLQQVVGEIEAKDLFTKVLFEDINREIDNPLRFKFDATSGVSANTRLTYKAKKLTVEKILNELSDKYEFGWFVISNEGNNKEDGAIMIRKNSKGKERGYELGKEPKKGASLDRQILPARAGIQHASIEFVDRRNSELIAAYYRKLNDPRTAD
jgi:hypothetical protein